MTESTKPHVQPTSPRHEVLAAIRRAHRVYVATLVAPGDRTTYILIPKTAARCLMENHAAAFITNNGGDLFIGPASRIADER